MGASTDDCWRRLVSDYFDTTSTIFAAGDYSSSVYDYAGGSRFQNVTIGQGDNIDAASMQLRASALYNLIPPTRIEGENADDTSTFSDKANYDGRPRTSAVSWTPPAWVVGTWYTTSELKTIIQAIVDRGSWASGNALVTFWRYDAVGWGGTRTLLTAHSWNSNSAFAPKLDIDYSAGFVEGAVSLSGVGSMAAVAGITLPAEVAMSGVGTMVVAGTKGATKIGQVALSGVGTMSGAGVVTATGRAVLIGVGSMTVVGERIVPGAVAMSGVGSMSAIGEVAGLLEGRADISGVGSMTVVAERIAGGSASFSGVGSMSVEAVVTLVGQASLSGVGSMAVIGETGIVLYTIFGGVLRSIDPADYPDGAQFFLEVTLLAGSGTAKARLYNVTDAAEVSNSPLSTSSLVPVRIRSSALTLASGANTYRVEYGGAPDGEYTIYAADLLVESD